MNTKKKNLLAFYVFLASFVIQVMFRNRDIPCQLTPFLVFFGRPSPILLKFGMFVGLDEKMSHTKFQVSKSNSF